MVKVMDCGIVVKLVQTPVALFIYQYPWERYELPYPPCNGLKIMTTVFLALAINN